MESMSSFSSDFFYKGVDPSLLMQPMEQRLAVQEAKTRLRIGVPREKRLQESRVALIPRAVGVLTARGHDVIVERGAGNSSQFSDREYSDMGAIIAESTEETFNQSDVIVKVSPLDHEELPLLHDNQILISAVHLGAVTPEYLNSLMSKNITALGFEFIRAADGGETFVRMMGEIAGITSIHIAGELLSKHSGGKGLLLGGITGVPPACVTIIGAGTVGAYAAKTALSLGATVKVIDIEVYILKQLEERLGMKVYTAVSQQDYLEDAIRSSDVLIGAAHLKGRRAPLVVTEDMVCSMKEGSIIIDVAIDQGGCVETSRLTSHDRPTFVQHDIIHYCVPNIPSRVSRTASSAISNILSPLLIKIGEAGSVQNLLAMGEESFRSGIYVYRKHLTQRSLASMFNMDFMDIDLLHAALW